MKSPASDSTTTFLPPCRPQRQPCGTKRLHWPPVRTGVKKDARGAAWNGNQHGGLLPGKHFSVKVQIHIDFVPHKVTYHGSRSQEHWFKTMLVTGRGNFKAKETACLKNAHFCRKKAWERKETSISFQGTAICWAVAATGGEYPKKPSFVVFGVRKRSHSIGQQ